MIRHAPRGATSSQLAVALTVALIGAALAFGLDGWFPRAVHAAEMLDDVGEFASPAASHATVSSSSAKQWVERFAARARPTASRTQLPVAPADLAPPPSDNKAPLPEARPKVGIQAGHWRNQELPAELASLRGSTGAAGRGWREVDVNLDVARRTAALLEQRGVQVDILPATVPPGYVADAFVSLHGDANGNPTPSGYKLARARSSVIPERDDALLLAMSTAYREITGLAEHPATITENMRQYYAFNRRLKHSVSPFTPAVILEMGFLTTASDLKLLTERPDLAAQAVARGLLDFLGR